MLRLKSVSIYVSECGSMFKITIIVVGQCLVTRLKVRFYDTYLCTLFKFKIYSHDIWTIFKDRF